MLFVEAYERLESIAGIIERIRCCWNSLNYQLNLVAIENGSSLVHRSSSTAAASEHEAKYSCRRFRTHFLSLRRGVAARKSSKK